MRENINLPKHWQVKRLGEVCQTTSGGTPSRSQSKYYNGTIPWVKSGELDKGLILETEEKITQEAIENSSAKIFPKGTLLIALYGATIGKLAFLGIDAATNQAVCGIFKNENIDSNYLFHFLFYKKPSLVKQSIGGGSTKYKSGYFKKLRNSYSPNLRTASHSIQNRRAIKRFRKRKTTTSNSTTTIKSLPPKFVKMGV